MTAARHNSRYVLILPLCYLCWLVFTGTFAVHELLIGVLSALLASTGMFVIDKCYPAHFSPELGELLTLWRIPGQVISGTRKIVSLMAKDFLGIRRAQSVFSVAPFAAGRKDDPHASARRVLAVAYSTVSPDIIVMGVNTADNKLLFHQLENGPVPKLIQELGETP